MKTKGGGKGRNSVTPGPNSGPEPVKTAGKSVAEAEKTVIDPSEKTPGADGAERVAISWYQRDGKIQWDRMRPSMREAIHDLLANPEVIAQLGLKEEGRELVEFFNSEWAGKVYDLLGPFEAFLAEKFGKVPHDLAVRVFVYSDAEKKILGPPTAAVLNKYAVEWLVKFKEEIALAMVFVGVTFAKVNAVKAMMQAAQQPGSAPAPSVTQQAVPQPDVPKKEPVQ